MRPVRETLTRNYTKIIIIDRLRRLPSVVKRTTEVTKPGTMLYSPEIIDTRTATGIPA
jgi:hypothetical protein